MSGGRTDAQRRRSTKGSGGSGGGGGGDCLRVVPVEVHGPNGGAPLVVLLNVQAAVTRPAAVRCCLRVCAWALQRRVSVLRLSSLGLLRFYKKGKAAPA